MSIDEYQVQSDIEMEKFTYNLPDRELVLRLQQDDVSALSKLYFSNIRALKYFILKTAKSPELTDDILHDTFIRIWENRMTIDPEKTFRPFLYTVAQRVLLNFLKRAQHERRILDEIQKYAITSEHSTELLVAYNESNNLLKQAIADLPPRCREVFLRCKIEGLSHKQTANELGISESTVNNQMGKALKNIKDFMAGQQTLALIITSLML
ncbi:MULTISPECIES: RNA polymerase sigma factor [unclassified Sphingobacterium]|uniref:RNA polymerase sigma factor n=1 Tax=unclassified Sphingobacterium TaxID=2609468 RepID=UPI00104D0287|nr:MULTISPECIES: RNA polymerase sigma-70 factor [unclassified Sphingobacterium]MCS3556143.1 RNA polymerase sigma-70 factor (ECF subfamily) [Sphingobacterium sp. JUb21]TCR08519.1 RNA polymerase sigma-70 factor (ECF subfamily) [Sphingobacterium sp. JUb20]